MQSFGGAAKWLAEEMGVSDVTLGAAAKAAGTPFARGGGNLLLWQRKVAEWATAEQQTAEETSAEEPAAQESGKRKILEHARMEFSFTDFSDLVQFLRVAVPESGKVTVEW